MSRFALVVSDVDGTLVTRDKMLTPRAIAAVGRLRERGIAFSICSSRPPVVTNRYGDHVDHEMRTIQTPPTVVSEFAEEHFRAVGKIVGASNDHDRIALVESAMQEALAGRASAGRSRSSATSSPRRDARTAARSAGSAQSPLSRPSPRERGEGGARGEAAGGCGKDRNSSYSAISDALIPPLQRPRAFILVEARDALGVQLRVVNRTAFLAHPRGAEGGVGRHQAIVVLALDDVLARRPSGDVARVGLRAVGDQLALLRLRRLGDRDPEHTCRRQSQACRSPVEHDRRLLA
jgi:hypothetical protein